MDILIQVLIFVFGVSSIFLVGCRNEKYRRWGYVTGLTAQPVWLYWAASTESWGVFLMALFYAYSWARGVYNFFIVKPKKDE